MDILKYHPGKRMCSGIISPSSYALCISFLLFSVPHLVLESVFMSASTVRRKEDTLEGKRKKTPRFHEHIFYCAYY
jgi:hypothetical protein